MVTNVIQYLMDTTIRHREKTAVNDDCQSITWGEFRNTVESISSALFEKLEGRQNTPIGVFLPKSAHCITVFMSIIASGNFYVPLDTKMPAARLEKIITNLNPSTIICMEKDLEQLREQEYECPLYTYEELKSAECPRYDLGTLTTKIIDTDPAYIIYTSGSTGTPKGVIVNHRGIIDLIEWAAECFQIDAEEIIGSQAPFYFDTSTLDLYLCFKTGATFQVIPETLFAFPVRLMEYVEEKKVTFIFWVPSVLINVANTKALDKLEMKQLRKILFAGEVMPNKHLNYWRQKLPQPLYANLYGPTEITVACTYFIVNRVFQDEEPLPIGFPCRNSDIIVLNEADQPCKTAEPGELCVRGSSLALGYWNDSEKTNWAFCVNPVNHHYQERIYRTGDLVYVNENGEIIFVGRKDNQIKHMGYRIELGEIENTIISLDHIGSCCVLFDEQKKQLAAFYEDGDGARKGNDLRRLLLTKLPKYMVPIKYFKMEKLPLNANGKVDRLKLKQLL